MSWTVGFLTREEGDAPAAEAIEAAKKEQLGAAVLEVAVLERSARQAATYRALGQEEVEKAIADC